MADPTWMLTTIDDYLLSLAQGIQYAQVQLNQISSDGPGARAVAYYLPKLDFELRMTLKIVEDSSLTQKYASKRIGPSSDQHLAFHPVSPAEAGAASFKAEIISTVRGSFVAVPANDGKPAVLLRSVVGPPSNGEVALEIQAISTIGERVPGLEIQLNIDRELSVALSKADGINITGLRAGTSVRDGVVTTDAQGVAGTTLAIDANEIAGTDIALTVDALGRTEIIVVRV